MRVCTSRNLLGNALLCMVALAVVTAMFVPLIGPAAAGAAGLSGQAPDHAPRAPEPPLHPAPEPGHPAPAKVTRFGRYGLNLHEAWSRYTRGSHNMIVAYVEGGINYYDPIVKNYVNDLYVNWRELPVPCVGKTIATATMTVNGHTERCALHYSNKEANYELYTKGYVNVTDWKSDPRVTDRGPGGILDPEDLIAAFSNGVDHDHDGYPNDISGWNVYRHNNDPATSDSTYDHSDNQMNLIHEVCPDCSIMPVKAGVEALDDTQRLAEAYLYAARAGAKVIVSVTADLGHSRFQQEVLNYLRKKGVALVEATNDFDSTDHQGGMYWNHVLGGNGVVADKAGTGWVRSDLTSWGSHAMFVVPSNGGSTSESTPTLGASFALLFSYAEQAYANHQISSPLSVGEAIQLMRETSHPFTNTTMSWPGADGAWSLQYGYGIPDVAAAMARLDARHEVPPSVEITSPSWYTLADPTRESSVALRGIVHAPAGQGFHWTAEAALGAEPLSTSWFVIGSGSGHGSTSGILGRLDLSSIAKSFWDAAFHLSKTKQLGSTEEYTVTLRVVVTDDAHQSALDRRSIYVVHDPDWLPGFPMRLSSSGESQPVAADLQGTGQMDLVFGTANGTVDAIDPMTGRELPGWPVHTLPVKPQGPVPRGIDPGSQPILADVAIGDLFHTGNLDVVAVSLEGVVYAWDAAGHLLPGWPKVMDRGVRTSFPVPRPGLPYTRLASMCGIAAPVLSPIGGGNQLDVIVAGCDGYLHVWQPDGHDLAGWPVAVTLPAGFQVPKGYSLLADEELGSTPTIVHLAGTKGLDIVERSQYSEITGSGLEPFPYGTAFAYQSDGKPVSGWDPLVMPGVLEYYDSAQSFVTEGSDEPAAFDPSLALPARPSVPPRSSVTPRSDAQARASAPALDEPLSATETAFSADGDVEIGPVWTTPYLYGASGRAIAQYGSVYSALNLLPLIQGSSKSAAQVPRKDRFLFPFSTSAAVGRLGGKLAVVQQESGARSFAVAELASNNESGIDQYLAAYPASPPAGGATAAPGRGLLGPEPALAELPGFPSSTQGLDFLGEPIVAPLGRGGSDAVVVGGDSNAIEAVTKTGQEVPGFPKWTTGWTLFAPTVSDLAGNGKLDLISVTREGYLMIWTTNAPASKNDQWWSAAHDNWNTGLYGLVTRPPGVPRKASFAPGAGRLSFEAPGGTWYSGEVAGYRITYEPSGRKALVRPSGRAGTTQVINVARSVKGVEVQAENTAGLLGTPVLIRRGSGAASRAESADTTLSWIMAALALAALLMLALTSFLRFRAQHVA